MRKLYLISTHLMTGKIHYWDSGEFESREAALNSWAETIISVPFMALMDVLTEDQWRITQETGLQWFDESNVHLFDDKGELKHV